MKNRLFLRKSFFILWMFFIVAWGGFAVQAQFRVAPAPVKTIGESITCQVGNSKYRLTPNKKLIAGIKYAPNDEETQGLFDKISEFTELRSNIYTVPVVDDINVEICPGEVNYIAYNGDWLQKVFDETNSLWALYAIIAHEIGHYVKAHDRTALGSEPKIELAADEYAGEILAKMGACLSDAESAYRSKMMGKNQSSHTHPPIADRLDAVRKGWRKFGKNCSAAVGETRAGASRQFIINTPSKGESVGITSIVRGRTPFTGMNHYLVVISLQAKRYYIQPPVKILPNGDWEGFAAFGTESYGAGDQWSIRGLATKSVLQIGELFEFPKDAVFSNEIVVRRDR